MATTAEVVQRLAKAMSAGGEDERDRVCDPDIEFVVSGANLRGVPAVRKYITTFSTALPDAKAEPHKIFESGSEAAVELTYSGTHNGPLATPQGEVPPTGRSISVPGAAFVRVAGDQVVSFHGYYDQVDMMTQLGMMPAPSATTGDER